MSLSSALGGYLDEMSQLPPETMLGVICFYKIKEQKDGEAIAYDRNVIESLLDRLGMDPELLPPPDAPINDWKAATGSVNEFEYQMPVNLATGPATGIILARRIQRTKAGATRLFVREIRDERRGTLHHDVIAEAHFMKQSIRQGRAVAGSERITVMLRPDAMHPGEREILTQILRERVLAEFDRMRKTINAHKVRAMARDALRAMGAIPIRPSVWFAHLTQADQMRKLRDLLLELDCELDRIPLPRIKECRMMLIRAVDEDTVTELGKVIQDIARLRSVRQNITGGAYAQMKARYDAIMDAALQYTDWLDSSLDSASSAASLAMASLTQLQHDMVRGMGTGDDGTDAGGSDEEAG